MEERETIIRIAWDILRLVVGVVIVCPILMIGAIAFMVGVVCDRVFYFVARTMRIDLENK